MNRALLLLLCTLLLAHMTTSLPIPHASANTLQSEATFEIANSVPSSTYTKYPRLASSGSTLYLGGSTNQQATLWSKSAESDTFGPPTSLGAASNGGKAADFANSAIATGPDGTVYEVWNAQFSGIFMQTRTSDGQTGTQRTITSGNVFRAFVDIGVTTNGTIIVAWYAQENGADSERYYASISQDKGASWTQPQVLVDEKSYRAKPWVTTGPNNTAIVAYFSYPSFNLYASIYDGNTGFTRELVAAGGSNSHNQNADPTASISGTGAMYVAWRTVYGDARYAERVGANSWRATTIVSPASATNIAGTVGIDADSNNNIYVTWATKTSPMRVYYAYKAANDSFSSIQVYNNGGYNPSVEGTIGTKNYGHVAFEFFEGDSMTIKYLRYSSTGTTAIRADPTLDSGAASTKSTSVSVSFANVTGEPTQVRWKWDAAPSDTSSDSNGWQAFTNPLTVSLPSTLSSNTCRTVTLFTQVKNDTATQATASSDYLLYDASIQAVVGLYNPHMSNQVSTFQQGAMGGDPSFTRENTIKLTINNAGDCAGLSSYTIGTNEQKSWDKSANVATQTIIVSPLILGKQSTPVTINDALDNTTTANADYYYDPRMVDSTKNAGGPQYTAGTVTLSGANSLFQTLTFSNVDVTDTIYSGAMNKPFWGVWVAASKTQYTEDETNSDTSTLKWTPIRVDSPGASFSVDFSLGTGQGVSSLTGYAGTYYVYVKFLDGAGNPSVKTLISDPVTLTSGYSTGKITLPGMIRSK